MGCTRARRLRVGFGYGDLLLHNLGLSFCHLLLRLRGSLAGLLVAHEAKQDAQQAERPRAKLK